MIDWSLISEKVARYGWLFSAALLVICLVLVGLRAKIYRADPTPQNKIALNNARKLCLLWLTMTAILGGVFILAVPHLVTT